MSTDENSNELHLVMFPFLAFGHISPFVQLSNKLSSYSGIRISFLAASANVRRIETMLNRTAATQIIGLRTFEASDLLYIFKSFHGTPSINKPLLLIGPVVPEPHSGELDQTWTNWLTHFPARSVIYCSFGSETFLSDDQITELALGLELTGLPFFLVLNFPANLDSSVELKRTLPRGFMERVKGKGVVHSGWVQQRHILAHESVGCYVCHAGFSSVIEALVNDCQLVMLPLKGDQFMNSKLMELDWKVGVEVNRRDEDGYFGKEDVFEAVKSVMIETEKEPAKSIRENHKKWKGFLQNDEIHNKYIIDLVRDLKTL
ncbi:unnamed protein product [Lactuca virosa]|uniref:UDP-glycosyltransferases domain-containing protein n=1 Tax=Lactuca virosa TaxID=75947 RepID=A0AAU9PAE2_9ASTR|nr:unnamed protein product [Lactuca virosa]